MASPQLLEAILTQSGTSLYRRLGGYDVIAAVIDDMFAILHDDQLVRIPMYMAKLL